ncbi:hypothetical protein LZ31DRAFT_196344 [Colletotrichum somersetense]|nr:hypothetical protein LZ31DRAFT_196344 [Colletotrichum somersetense]
MIQGLAAVKKAIRGFSSYSSSIRLVATLEAIGTGSPNPFYHRIFLQPRLIASDPIFKSAKKPELVTIFKSGKPLVGDTNRLHASYGLPVNPPELKKLPTLCCQDTYTTGTLGNGFWGVQRGRSTGAPKKDARRCGYLSRHTNHTTSLSCSSRRTNAPPCT